MLKNLLDCFFLNTIAVLHQHEITVPKKGTYAAYALFMDYSTDVSFIEKCLFAHYRLSIAVL